MSSRIRKNTSFLSLLLTTHPTQQKALLDSVTESQANLISELVFNLLFVLPLKAKEQSSLRRKDFLKDLSKIKRSFKYRKAKIKTYKKQLLKVLDTYKTQLLDMVH